jgi:multiple sugar transport system substrate-binding protein
MHIVRPQFSATVTVIAMLLAACAPASPAPATGPPAQATTAPPVAAATAAPKPTAPAATSAPAPTTAAAATTAPAPTTAAAASTAKVKIRATVWISQPEQDALDQMVLEYQKTHPNVEVEWINITGGGLYGRDKLQTMLAGGDAPDMMMLNTGQFEGLASRGVLRAVDDLVEQDKLDLGVYWPQGIDGVKYGGKMYGLPRDLSDVILYYNKDLFDAAGVAYPNDNWTWNDMRDAAKKLTLDKGGTGKTNQWGFGVGNYTWTWTGFVWGNGGEVLSPDRKSCLLDQPQSTEAMRYYFGLLSDDKVSPPPGALPEQASVLDYFTTQSIAMGLYGPWFRPTLVNAANQFHWDVAQPPKSPTTGQRGSVVYTDEWGIYSGSKIARETWDFMKFLTGKDGQTKWNELIGARSISPIKEVAQTDKWIHYGGSSGQIILDTLTYSKAPPVNFGNANEAETVWTDELGLVVAGQEPIDAAVKNVCSKVAPVLTQ